MCQFSATFCKGREAHAVDAEFEERRAQERHGGGSGASGETGPPHDVVAEHENSPTSHPKQRAPEPVPPVGEKNRLRTRTSSIEMTTCPRCESTCVVHLMESIGFNQWKCNQCLHQWNFASAEERAVVPQHLTGSRIEQFLEDLLAIKAVTRAEAEKIWNGCFNVHQMISVAADDEKRRMFSEQYEKWRNQLIGLQEILIADHLTQLVARYQVFANEQTWLLRTSTEVWRPITDGYLDWLTVAVCGHVDGAGTGSYPKWAWQLPGAPRDVARLDLIPEKKASGHC